MFGYGAFVGDGRLVPIYPEKGLCFRITAGGYEYVAKTYYGHRGKFKRVSIFEYGAIFEYMVTHGITEMIFEADSVKKMGVPIA